MVENVLEDLKVLKMDMTSLDASQDRLTSKWLVNDPAKFGFLNCDKIENSKEYRLSAQKSRRWILHSQKLV